MPNTHPTDRRFSSYFEHNDDGKLQKYNCLTCCHNNEIVIQAPGVVWDFCMKCNAVICAKCAQEMAKTGECVAFERRLLKMENKTRLPHIERMRAHIIETIERQKADTGTASPDLVRFIETT